MIIDTNKRIKKMKVLSKREFNKLQRESLFKAGGTLTESKLPYCTGKYKKSIIGRDLKPCGSEFKAIYAVAKSDRYGTYYQLRSAI